MPKGRKNGRVVWPVVIGLTTLVIWGFSLTPAETSTQQSGFVRQLLLALLGEGALADFFLTHVSVRKLAHFTEYFVLGGEWALYQRTDRRRWLGLCGLPVAAVDECLQFFSPGRGPAVADVLLDTVGYACGFALFWLLARTFARNKNKSCILR